MLWYTIRLISVLTNVMEYVYFVCPSFKTKKTACPNGPFIPAIRTGGLDFLIAYAMLILRHAFRDNCYLTLILRWLDNIARKMSFHPSSAEVVGTICLLKCTYD